MTVSCVWERGFLKHTCDMNIQNDCEPDFGRNGLRKIPYDWHLQNECMHACMLAVYAVLRPVEWGSSRDTNNGILADYLQILQCVHNDMTIDM